MTTISGLWRFRTSNSLSEDIRRMTRAQAIYGSHKVRFYVDAPTSLAAGLTQHLPEDAYDNQPLIGGGGRFVLVADVRLDNREELATLLEIPSSNARIMCDASILLAAFEKWQEGCCSKLVGDYAFALWDKAEQRLVLARDYLGFRPLHFHFSDGFFAFSSMPKGLHALPEITREPDQERVAEFLALMPEYGTSSFFKNIQRVEPGSILVAKQNEWRTQRHWTWEGRKVTPKGGEDLLEGLLHHLDQAVRDRTRGASDRLASHLSAGIDSSAVTTTAARILRPSGGKVTAFTAAPREGYDLQMPSNWIGDETRWAQETSSLHDNIEHVVIRTGDHSPVDLLDRAFYLFERPILNICNHVWLSAINDAVVQRQMSVLLIGQMGNSSLTYAGEEVFSEMLSTGQMSRWWRLALANRRNRGARWRGLAARTLAPWLSPDLWCWVAQRYYGHPTAIQDYSILNPVLMRELDLHSRAREHGLDLSYRPWKNGLDMRLWALRRNDFGLYTKGVLGGWGIDMRDPTADRRLVEYCLTIPTEEFFRGGVERGLARAALKDRIPAAVLKERRKGIQAVDWHEPITKNLLTLKQEISAIEGLQISERILDTHRMRRLVEDWPTKGWDQPSIVNEYRLALLRGVSAGNFLRRASGAN